MLFDVTGTANWCAPCSMSAATGLSTDQWDDEPWSIDGADPMIHITSALEGVWFEVARDRLERQNRHGSCRVPVGHLR